jgi:hypothetical protein
MAIGSSLGLFLPMHKKKDSAVTPLEAVRVPLYTIRF